MAHLVTKHVSQDMSPSPGRRRQAEEIDDEALSMLQEDSA